METKNAFLRIGATIALTESEFDLLRQENEQAANMVREKLAQGGFKIEGETCFPAFIGATDDTWRIENDIDFEFWEDED